jgi:hypothetical protein
MIPRHYQHLTEMPLSINRKVDRPALRERARDQFRAGTRRP